MISKRVEINRSCDSVNYPTMTVVAASTIKVMSIGVNVQSTRSQTELDNGAVSTIEIIVQFNGQNISSGTIQMTTADRHDEFFTLPNDGLVVEVGQTFNVVCPYAYCHAYAQNAMVAESGIIINGNAYNIILNYQYEPVFIYDAQNNGYPYAPGTDPTVFTEFTKDRDGYSTNLSTWKLDENNDGYPWIAGFPLIRREQPVKFVNDNALNNLTQKINSIFRVDSKSKIQHNDLNVRKLDAQKINIDSGNETRIETTDSGIIKLGRTTTDANYDTSVLSILNDEVTVKHSLDSHNIKSRWISSHDSTDVSLILSCYSQSETNLLTGGYPFLRLYTDGITLSGNSDISDSEASPFITVDSSSNGKIRLDSNILTIYSGKVTIKNKLSIGNYLTVYNDGNMMFRTSDKSIGMYTESDSNDISDLTGEKIRLSNKGLITLCGRDYIRIGISRTLNVVPAMSTFYETIIAHYGDDYRWLHLTCPNSNVSLQLETDKAYYTKVAGVPTANDEIATIGNLSGYIPINGGNYEIGDLSISRSGSISLTAGTFSSTSITGYSVNILGTTNGVNISSSTGDIIINPGTSGQGTFKAYYRSSSSADNEIATIGDITSRIQESDAMQYKGSINASADLPTVSNTTNNLKVGATYKVATAGSYSYYNGTSTITQACKVGDLFIAKVIASGATKTITWDYIPAADDVLALSYITSGTPTISTTAQTGTAITLGSVVTKMAETTLTFNANNVPTSSAVMTYFGNYIPNIGNTLSDVNTIITRTKTTGTEVGEDVDIQTGKLTVQPNKVELYLDNDCTYDSEGDRTGYVTIDSTSAKLYSKYGNSISQLILSTASSSQLVSQESLLIKSTDGNITLQSDDLIIKAASTAYYTHSSTVTDDDEIAVKGDILQIAEDIDYNLYKVTIDELKTWNSTGTWTIDSSTSDYVYYDYAINNGHYLVVADVNTNYVVSILGNDSSNVDTEIIIYNKKLPEIPKVSLNSHFSNSGSESTYYTKIVYNGQTYKDYGNSQAITTVTNQVAVISYIIKANSNFDTAPVLSKPIYKNLPYKTPQPTVTNLQTQINDLINKLNNLS